MQDWQEVFLELGPIVKNDFPRAWVACQPRGVEQLANSCTGLLLVWEFGYFKPAQLFFLERHPGRH